MPCGLIRPGLPTNEGYDRVVISGLQVSRHVPTLQASFLISAELKAVLGIDLMQQNSLTQRISWESRSIASIKHDRGRVGCCPSHVCNPWVRLP